MIYLYTDFRYDGPYVGQMKTVLSRLAPDVPVIDIMHDAPFCDPKRAAYLLAAVAQESQFGDIWLCVVDPGVGGDRRPAVLDCGGVCFVGPDNGLFELIFRRIEGASLREIIWRPEIMSATFHGRDLFAPIAARLAKGHQVPSESRPVNGILRPDWPDDLQEVIYFDHFGNAITGVRAENVPLNAEMVVNGRRLLRARTFSDLPKGGAFLYKNSSGLVEFAVNQGDANTTLGIDVGSEFRRSDIDVFGVAKWVNSC